MSDNKNPYSFPELTPAANRDPVSSPQSGGASAVEQPESLEDGLGSLAQSARKTHLASARVTMFVVGILTIAANVVMLNLAKANVDQAFNAEIFRLQEQGMEFDDAEIARLKEQAVVNLEWTSWGFIGSGVLFLVLGLLIYRFPVPCTVLGLILYLGGQAVTVAGNPEMLTRGIFLKVIIVFALVRAIQAAVAYQNEKKLNPA